MSADLAPCSVVLSLSSNCLPKGIDTHCFEETFDTDHSTAMYDYRDYSDHCMACESKECTGMATRLSGAGEYPEHRGPDLVKTAESDRYE